MMISSPLILVGSVSKRFSACGARIGVLISRNRELMSHALKYCQARLSVATVVGVEGLRNDDLIPLLQNAVADDLEGLAAAGGDQHVLLRQLHPQTGDNILRYV